MNELTVTPVQQPSRQHTPVSRSRLTVVENTVISSTESPQSVFDGSFSCWLDNGDEQPYGPRRIKVTDQWQPLDTGWLEGNAGMLTLRNDEGRNMLTNPTPEQLATIAAGVVEVGIIALVSGVVIPFSDVPAGRSIRLFPRSMSLFVRCLNGVARCTLFVVPQ